MSQKKLFRRNTQSESADALSDKEVIWEMFHARGITFTTKKGDDGGSVVEADLARYVDDWVRVYFDGDGTLVDIEGGQ